MITPSSPFSSSFALLDPPRVVGPEDERRLPLPLPLAPLALRLALSPSSPSLCGSKKIGPSLSFLASLEIISVPLEWPVGVKRLSLYSVEDSHTAIKVPSGDQLSEAASFVLDGNELSSVQLEAKPGPEEDEVDPLRLNARSAA
jgi:hypothetical protein